MEKTNASPFSQQEQDLSEFARSMSHPARIRIVTLFLEAESSLCCGEIVEKLPLAQSTVSQHLRELVETGILTMQKDRQTSCYQLNSSQLLNFCRSFQIAMGNQPKI
jgi:ArsR family transcriptional regulator, arsenate/arsenite/antimonite-responsive transcriptional repressor